jgi:AraC family transcriptional regulator, positive regulator of tynA and feaB
LDRWIAPFQCLTGTRLLASAPALNLPGMTDPAPQHQSPRADLHLAEARSARAVEAPMACNFRSNASATSDRPAPIEALFDIERRSDGHPASANPGDDTGLDVSHWMQSHPNGLGTARVVLLRAESDLLIRPSRQQALATTEQVVLWFCRKGRMLFSDYRGSVDALPGELVVTPVSARFSITCETGKCASHEAVYAVLPRIEIDGIAGGTTKSRLIKPMRRPEFGFASDMLASLCEHESGLTPESSALLRDSAVKIVETALGRPHVEVAPTPSIRDHRITEIVRYIEVRLSDANLSHARAARDCGVSPRYLTSLLNSHGTNFTEMVWQLRLEKAKSWLASSSPREISIAEIAFGLGFKSPCHFSRLFRRVYNASPRDFRPSQSPSLAASR